jgi:hypothetical protein
MNIKFMNVWFQSFVQLTFLQNSIKLQDCEKALSTAFGNGDLAGAIPLVQKMTYYDKISEEITRKL